MPSSIQTRKRPGQRARQTCLATLSAFLLAILFTFHLAAAQAPVQPVEVRLTPLLLAVPSAPVPFTGSDSKVHLAYELQLTNFTSSEAAVQHVDILSDGQMLATLDERAIAGRLQPFGTRTATDRMAPSTSALLFLHLALPAGATPPKHLTHRVTVHYADAPGGPHDVTVSGGEVAPSDRKPAVIGPPLAGERYIAADSCCDSSRHVRAALPINGQIRLAQRYAVDWEQIDRQNRIFAGPKEALRSYAIYGKEALAVADARVVSTVDGLPEQLPGRFPPNLPIEQADGNSVILDLGDGNYALYAHFQPGSLRVKPGDQVVRGQVLGLVGNSGNTVAPHLHFQLMDGPSSLGANGLPYHIDAFVVTGHTPGTAAFDEAEAKGTPLAITRAVPPIGVRDALPMDQSEIRFRR
jgi:hypothetical protein